jgi:hypothetical protein
MMIDKTSAAATVMLAEQATAKDLRSIAQKAIEAAREHAASEELLPVGMSQARGAANELVGLLDNFMNNRLTQIDRVLGIPQPTMPIVP